MGKYKVKKFIQNKGKSIQNKEIPGKAGINATSPLVAQNEILHGAYTSTLQMKSEESDKVLIQNKKLKETKSSQTLKP